MASEPRGCLAAIFGLGGPGENAAGAGKLSAPNGSALTIGSPPGRSTPDVAQPTARTDATQLPARAVGDAMSAYRLRESVLTRGERPFFAVLTAVVPERYVVCPGIGLIELFDVVGGDRNWKALNPIISKRVDFVVCERTTMQPVCGIELDDASHGRWDRRVRDEFVEHLFERTGLRLVRFATRYSYEPADVAARLHLAP